MNMALICGQWSALFMNLTPVEFSSRVTQTTRWDFKSVLLHLRIFVNQSNLFADAETFHGFERKIFQ